MTNSKTVVEEILDLIDTKTSWGKNQLKEEILKILAKRAKD